MKTFFIFLTACLLGACVHAQNIYLEDYKVGEQINDTIYSYYGNLGVGGNGNVNLTQNLSSELMPGVSFKIVIDSTNQGQSPIHAAFKIVDDKHIALKKGDTVSIPARLRLYAGTLGFHILIHGKPLNANQEYSCDLFFMRTMGEDLSLYISKKSNTTCSVGLTTGLKNKSYNTSFSVYPNPSTSEMTLSVSNEMLGQDYSISNSTGKMLTSGKIKDELSVISLDGLLPGMYYIAIENATPVKIIKQ